MQNTFVFPKIQGTYTPRFANWNARFRYPAFSKNCAVTQAKHGHGEVQMMDKKAPDRRINRTRKSLQDALAALILEKGYEKVTVQDIIERANVGRSTFYAHFQDIDDLLLSHLDEVCEQFNQDSESQIAQVENPWKLTLLIFQHTQKQHPLYKALIGGRGGNVILSHIDRHFSALIKELLMSQLSDRSITFVPSEILTHYIVSSLTSLLIWWLDHDLPYPAEQMNEMFRELIEHGVESVFEPIEQEPAYQREYH